MDARRWLVAASLLAVLACPSRPGSDGPTASPHDADVEPSPRGVVSIVVQKGTGTVHPRPNDYVEVKYAGWTRTGELFEGAPGEPRYLEMNQIVPGLAEGLAAMVEGEKRHLRVPAELAYGRRPDFVNAPRDEMTFDVELVRVIRLPDVPANLASPPEGARRTKSGLAYEVLTQGTGKVHPGKNARVELRYAMWTRDGKMIESSYLGPGTIPAQLPRLMRGWAEGLMLMAEGDALRLWIPGALANGEPKPNDDAPPFALPLGPLVIDVELVAILSP